MTPTDQFVMVMPMVAALISVQASRLRIRPCARKNKSDQDRQHRRRVQLRHGCPVDKTRARKKYGGEDDGGDAGKIEQPQHQEA